jgi:hypothetical protein
MSNVDWRVAGLLADGGRRIELLGDRYERHPIAIEQLDELGADADIVELVLRTS